MSILPNHHNSRAEAIVLLFVDLFRFRPIDTGNNTSCPATTYKPFENFQCRAYSMNQQPPDGDHTLSPSSHNEMAIGNVEMRTSKEWHEAELAEAYARSDQIRRNAEMWLLVAAEEEKARVAEEELAQFQRLQAAKAKAVAASAAKLVAPEPKPVPVLPPKVAPTPKVAAPKAAPPPPPPQVSAPPPPPPPKPVVEAQPAPPPQIVPPVNVPARVAPVSRPPPTLVVQQPAQPVSAPAQALAVQQSTPQPHPLPGPSNVVRNQLTSASASVAPNVQAAWDGSDPMKNPDLNNPISDFKVHNPSHFTLVDPEAYQRIHRNMKDLRKHVQALVDPDGSTRFKQKCNEMRRKMQMIVGQLTPDPAQKRSCNTRVLAILNEARTDTTHGCQVSLFSVCNRPKVESSDQNDGIDYNNGDEMSLQLVYLLASLAKIVVNQWINEASLDGSKADPVGALAIRVFCEKAFYWRGKTLIDILLAKIYVACPILFVPARDKPNTTEGRVQVGWRRRNYKFISEAEHYDRMAGIAAGFASLSLRSFAKAPTLKNPYPSTNYWFALAGLLHTPTHLVSPTHFVVLAAMIKDFVGHFIRFYGNYALSALHMAIVQFPAKISENNIYKSSLQNVADQIKQTTGHDFRA